MAVARSTFDARTATTIVIANMIGTGVFTSLGFQLLDIQSPFVLIMLWTVGGVIALAGALCYAELGAALPRSGGEYNFLSHIYHPGVGFVSGWISATIGFAAPTALAAMTFAAYLTSVAPAIPEMPAAVALVVAVALAHGFTRRASANFQQLFTFAKIVLIVGFCAVVTAMNDAPQSISFLPSSGDGALVTSTGFAVSLIYVNYAYTGWNVATYLSSELDEPQRHLPKILGIGTVTVMVMYLALNAVFLSSTPMASMAGEIEIGYVVARHALSDTGATVVGLILATLLISTVSAMVLAGPRVVHAIGNDFPALRWLGVTNSHGVPAAAIVFQSVLTIAMIVTATFESVLVFAGFTLALNTFFAVVGLIVLRTTEPDLPRTFRVPLYPLTPIVFLGLTGWTLTFLAIERPVEIAWAGAVIAAGAVFYALTRRLERVPEATSSSYDARFRPNSANNRDQ